MFGDHLRHCSQPLLGHAGNGVIAASWCASTRTSRHPWVRLDVVFLPDPCGIDNCPHGQQRTQARPRLWRQCSTTCPVLVNCLLNKIRLQQPRPDDTRVCDA